MTNIQLIVFHKNSHFYERVYIYTLPPIPYNQIMQNSKTTTVERQPESSAKETPASKLKQEMKRYMTSIASNSTPKDQHQHQHVQRDRQETSRSRQRKHKRFSKSKEDQKYNGNHTSKQNKFRKQVQKDRNSSGSDKPTAAKTSYDGEKKGGNPGAEKYYKTRLCPQFLDGNCERGIKCTYAHGESQLRQCNASFKTQLCHRFARGGCQKSKEQCKYAHGSSDLRSNDESKRNTDRHHHNDSDRGHSHSHSRSNPRRDNRQIRKDQSLQSHPDYNRAYQFSALPPPVVKPQYQPLPNTNEKRQQINNINENWPSKSRFEEPIRQRPAYYPNNLNPLPYGRQVKYLPSPAPNNQPYQPNQNVPIYGGIQYYQGYPPVYEHAQPPHSFENYPINPQLENNLPNPNHANFEHKPASSNFEHKQTLKFDNNVVASSEGKGANPTYQGYNGAPLYGHMQYPPIQGYPPNYNTLYPPMPYPPYGYDYIPYNFGAPQGYSPPVKSDKNNLTLRSDSNNGGPNVGGRVVSNRNGSFESKTQQSVLKGEKPQLLH